MSLIGSRSRNSHRVPLKSQCRAFKSCRRGRSKSHKQTQQTRTACFLVSSMIQLLVSTCAWTLKFLTTTSHRKVETTKRKVTGRATGASTRLLQLTHRPTTCRSASKPAALTRAWMVGLKRAVGPIHPPPPSYPKSPEICLRLVLSTKTFA